MGPGQGGVSRGRHDYHRLVVVGPAVIESLALIPFFAGLERSALERVAAGMRSRRFRRGEVIFHIGDPGDALFVIVDGQVKISLPSETGDEAILATLRGGDVFGELALLDDAPRAAQARAAEDCVLASLSRGDFESLLDTHAVVASKIALQLARQLGRQLRDRSASADRKPL